MDRKRKSHILVREVYEKLSHVDTSGSLLVCREPTRSRMRNQDVWHRRHTMVGGNDRGVVFEDLEEHWLLSEETCEIREKHLTSVQGLFILVPLQ